MKDFQIAYMVNQFLQWKLPDDFNPDGGVFFDRAYNPVGTNLFTAKQADDMVRHMIAGLPDHEPFPLVAGTRVRHRKGGIYQIVGIAKIEATLEEAIIYQAEKDGTIWVRPMKEFTDGRFIHSPEISVPPQVRDRVVTRLFNMEPSIFATKQRCRNVVDCLLAILYDELEGPEDER